MNELNREDIIKAAERLEGDKIMYKSKEEYLEQKIEKQITEKVRTDTMKSIISKIKESLQPSEDGIYSIFNVSFIDLRKLLETLDHIEEEYTKGEYTTCDCCGKKIYLGDTIYQFEGRCGVYCSPECYAREYAVKKTLTYEEAENSMCEVYSFEEGDPQ